VLARNSGEIMDIKINQLQIISLKPHEGGWKVLLDSKMESMAAALDKAAR
jgi:hypothetical protein